MNAFVSRSFSPDTQSTKISRGGSWAIVLSCFSLSLILTLLYTLTAFWREGKGETERAREEWGGRRERGTTM